MSKSDHLFAEVKSHVESARMLVAWQEERATELDGLGDKSAAHKALREFRKTLALFERLCDVERERERGTGNQIGRLTAS
jgi:hypothetical protein